MTLGLIVFLSKQLTPKFHDDRLSDGTAPSCDSSERSKLQTLSSFATVIGFWWQYGHLTENWTGLHEWISILKFSSKNSFLKASSISSRMVVLSSVAKKDSVWSSNFISSLLPRKGAVSSGISLGKPVKYPACQY